MNVPAILGVRASLRSYSQMPDAYRVVDRDPVEVRSPDAETWQLLGALQLAFPSGFWSSANDDQAARAVLRIIEGDE